MSARLSDSSPLFQLGGLEFQDPVLPKCTFPWKTFDVRVSDPTWAEPHGAPVSVSLQDILGGSLVTFGEHIGPPLDGSTPIPPKAVYVQYQEADPITGQLRPVIVPAQLCLDVYAELALGYDTPEEESLLEVEETEVEEQSDRRKLRSSIKGDPILLRSKPVRPPEPYFAVMREDGQVTQAAVLNPETAREALAASRDANGLHEDDGDGAACGSAWQQDGTVALGDNAEKLQGADRRKGSGLPMPKHVQTKSTVSSFIKAGGRDRYCRPRLREIDTILDRAAADSGNQPFDALPSMGPAALARTEAMASRLTAVLATDMHRMPQFHRARAASAAHHSSNSRPDVEQLPPATAADDSASTSDAAASLEEPQLSTDKADAADAQEEEADKKSIVGGASSEPRSWRRQDRRQTSSARSRGAAARKLRLIDPHVTTIGLPTQRLHCNWPYGIKREIARHFYGMTAEEVTAEEENERLADETGVPKSLNPEASASQLGDEVGDKADLDTLQSASDVKGIINGGRKQATRHRKLDSLVGQHGGPVAHRLEVRIRNIDRAERFVVAKCTPRLRGPKEALSRRIDLPTAEAAEATARFHLGGRRHGRYTVLYRDDVPQPPPRAQSAR